MISNVRSPRYLSLKMGGEKMRKLYSDGSMQFNQKMLSDFGLACFLGLYDEVKQLIENGIAPDICGHETPYRLGYLTLVVHGRSRIVMVPFATRHADIARFLIKAGAPTEQEDIALYTALAHATLRDGLAIDVARVLLEEGANPNHRNKYGAVPVLEACIHGSLKCIDLLLEFGADPTIADADGRSAGDIHLQAGPQVSALFMKWERKRSGAAPAAFEEKRCDGCGKPPGRGLVLRLCSRCRTTRYCTPECQRLHWQTHKASCRPFEKDNTLKFTPYYQPTMNVYSQSELIRKNMGMQQPTKRPQSSTGGKWPSKRDLPKQLVIKIQIPYPPWKGPAHVWFIPKREIWSARYAHKKNGSNYDTLISVIKEKGVGGAKAYFTAEMTSKDELIVKTGDVLAEQSF
ncbi:hypothetical protein M422DRAFT_59022 [Sphaerobolus stellatus SS14]|nr:hypothetical protein M422DRAFT_59022 [Sphaerobolus stellatus SS14]